MWAPKNNPLRLLHITTLESVLNRIVLLGFCTLLAGCGEPPGESHITGYTPKQILGEFSDLYRVVQNNTAGQQPAARLQELEKSKAGFPFAYKAALNGEIVVMWGAPLGGKETSILAYEKDTPAVGGWVLLQNGAVKQLSAAEFRSTPRASK